MAPPGITPNTNIPAEPGKSRVLALLRAYPFILPWAVCCLTLNLGYLSVFAISDPKFSAALIINSLVNTTAAFLVGVAFARLLQTMLFRLPPAFQLAGHVLLAPVYSITWYVTVITAMGWAAGSIFTGAAIAPFQGPAFPWQIFQGIALYFAIAPLAYLSRYGPGALNPAEQDSAAAAPDAPAMLVRDGDTLMRFEPDQIVQIRAQDDYSEIVELTTRRLVRSSLTHLEAQLPAGFVRIHRSTIVNSRRIVRTEPAGNGRMTVHLENGDSVDASRAGAKALRQLVL